MVFVKTWDESTPQGGEFILTGDDRIREFKQAIRERLAVDHDFLLTEGADPNIGCHKKATLIDSISDQLPVSGCVVLYAKNTSGLMELYAVFPGGLVVQLTTGGLLNGASLAALVNIPAAAGLIPLLNLGSGSPSALNFLRGNGQWSAIAAADLTPVILTPKEYTDTTGTSSSDQSTNQTTYQDTTLSISFTPGKQGLAFSKFSARADSSSGIAYAALLLDGTVVDENAIPSGLNGSPLSLSYFGVLSAAAHTIKIQIKGTGGGAITLKGTDFLSRLNVSYPT